MARFTFVDYDTDDSSVESSSVAPSEGSCSLDFSIDGDAFIHDNYFSADDETTVAPGESFIEESILGDHDHDDGVHESNDEVPVDSPLIVVAVAVPQQVIFLRMYCSQMLLSATIVYYFIDHH